jgi:hypothetical protein
VDEFEEDEEEDEVADSAREGERDPLFRVPVIGEDGFEREIPSPVGTVTDVARGEIALCRVLSPKLGVRDPEREA